MHSGFCRIENGDYTGGVFGEMRAQRHGHAFRDALNGDRIGVVAFMSDAAFPRRTDPARDDLGAWVSLVSQVGSESPMKLWVRTVPPPGTPKCLLIARFSSGDGSALDRRSVVISELTASLNEIQEAPPEGWSDPILEVGSWAQDGVSVAVLAKQPAAFLVGYLLPYMTRRLLILGQRGSLNIQMNAGIHTVEDAINGDDISFVTAARLARGARMVRGGIPESDATSVCLVSTQARSSAVDNLTDFIDPTRYMQIPEEGLEESLDSWLFVPYAPHIQ
ncbi:hypothetical protein ABZX75_26290 [Streptomyces sp. NPDC003038]|uniref:hypothetical protein n=1 Tax=unclassified Streptomyces TaxID=2593676 RepID=UPI0033A1957C